MLEWLDARPGIGPELNFGAHYYDYARGSKMNRTSDGHTMTAAGKAIVLAAIAFLFVGIVAVVLLLPTLY